MITDTVKTRVDCFSIGLCQIGDVLGLAKQTSEERPYSQYLCVDLIHKTKCSSPIPIGIAMSHVVNLDLTRQHINWHRDEVQIGGKIYILTEGKVTLKLPKSLKLPYKQPIYVNLLTSKLTYKKLGPKVGRLDKPQDQDGFCVVCVNFN
jgi:hypothetical protein